MNFSDVEIGQQVICTKVYGRHERSFPEHFLGDTTDNILCLNRVIGHIGYIACVFPITESVQVLHQEFSLEHGRREFITSFFADELDVFDAPAHSPKTKLQKSIKGLHKWLSSEDQDLKNFS